MKDIKSIEKLKIYKVFFLFFGLGLFFISCYNLYEIIYVKNNSTLLKGVISNAYANDGGDGDFLVFKVDYNIGGKHYHTESSTSYPFEKNHKVGEVVNLYIENILEPEKAILEMDLSIFSFILPVIGFFFSFLIYWILCIMRSHSGLSAPESSG